MHDGTTYHKSKVVRIFLGQKHSIVGVVGKLTVFKSHWKYVDVVKKCRENSQQATKHLVTAMK